MTRISFMYGKLAMQSAHVQDEKGTDKPLCTQNPGVWLGTYTARCVDDSGILAHCVITMLTTNC